MAAPLDPRKEAAELATRVCKGEIAGVLLIALPTKDGHVKSSIVGAVPNNNDLLAAISTSCVITLGEWLATRLKASPTARIDYGDGT